MPGFMWFTCFPNGKLVKLATSIRTGVFALERSAREQLEELLAEVGVDAVVVLDDGDVPRVVRNVAGSIGADLVVIGRHAGAGILGRLREHAYAIVRESPCPVVSV